jgi:uncharacterized protein YjbI with pentapeptide repeats
MGATGWLVVGSVGLTLLLIAGIWLALPRAARHEHHEQLGRTLIAGALVGLALVPLQLAAGQYLRERDRHNETAQQQLAQRRDLLQQLTFAHDLRGIDLHGEDLRGLYLRGKNLRGANLTATDLRGATLDSADIRGADLSGARLDRARLRSARLRGALLRDTSFWHADLSRADLRRVRPGPQEVSPPNRTHEPNFAYAQMVGADLRHTFLPADFHGANLSRALLRRAYLGFANLRSATFVNTDARGTMLCRADATRAVFGASYLVNANFIGTDLRRATISTSSDLRRADFRKADLRSARVAKGFDLRTGVSLHYGPVILPYWIDGMRGTRYDRRTRGAANLVKAGAWAFTPVSRDWECFPDEYAPGHPLSHHAPPRRRPRNAIILPSAGVSWSPHLPSSPGP